MNTTDRAYFQKKLEEERTRLIGELGELGRINPTNANDWETTYSNLQSKIGEVEIPAEPDEQDEASRLEEFEERNATEVTLEGRLNTVKDALARVESGTYGMCMEGAAPHPIEHMRLEANPAAATCLAHLKK